LLLTNDLAMTYVFGVLLGMGFGGRTSLTTAIRGVYFGRKAFASITGISMIPMNILLLVAPPFAGFMFDRTGSYMIPMATIGAVNLFGSSLFLFLGPPGAGVPVARAPAAASGSGKSPSPA
jgi:MFS family permease